MRSTAIEPSLSASPFPLGMHRIAKPIVSAGSVILDRENGRVCTIFNQRTKELAFPKGRYNSRHDPSLSAAAERESFEETGYKVAVDPHHLLAIRVRPL